MIDPENVPEVDLEETVARYIVAGESTKSLRKYVRADNTVKHLLFLPFSHVDISVNRHRDCSENEIWQFGVDVAEIRNKTLYGRSDIAVADCTLDSLSVVAKRIEQTPERPGNPNHADITGFPGKKEDQMSLAEKLAAKAGKRKHFTMH